MLTTGGDSGIGGGVVSMTYFESHFGLLNPDMSTNKKKSDDVTSNVVSVLQAGAFFGALGSAPISGELALLVGLGEGGGALAFNGAMAGLCRFDLPGECSRRCMEGRALVMLRDGRRVFRAAKALP